ncbi:MAG: hypothetical protein HWE25_05180 [Alphaproteobacteria bacterium]|nr:hypothetical protein [Alphaproteobacteria bacterium]
MSINHEYMSRLMAIAATVSLALLFLLSVPVKAENSQIFYMNPDRNIALGQRAMAAGDYETAVSHFSKAATGNLSTEHMAIVQNSLCASLYFQGEYERAAEACTDAIAEDGRYWKAFVNRGNARKALGDTRSALADYCAAHALSPRHVRGPFVSQCEG